MPIEDTQEEKLSPEASQDFDLICKYAPSGDYNHDETMHMADWWRNFCDGQYDSPPATDTKHKEHL